MKKKFFAYLLSAAFLMSLCGCGNKSESTAVSAPQIDDGRVNPISEVKLEWEYDETDDGSISIKAYNGKAAVVTVPSEIDGKPVKRLGLFFDIDNEVSTTLVLPASLEYLPYYSLGKNISEIVVEEGNEKYYSKDGMVFSRGYFSDALYMCPQGKKGEIAVPDGTEGIGNFAFSDCYGITAVKIPESVTWLGSGVFNDCTALTSVNIPRSVTMIGGSTFCGCTSLETLDIPETVTDIGSYAFFETPFLDKLIERDPFVVINGILVDGTTLKGEVTIPDNVTKIAGNAFSSSTGENTELKKVILPESFTEVDSWAFEDCIALEEVVLPKGIERIDMHAFSGCTALKSIDLPSGLKYIGMYAFEGCTGLTSVDIPEGVTEIDMLAFKDCEDLERVSVPDSVVDVGLNNCFNGCEKINVTFKEKTYTAANIDEFYKAVEDNRKGQEQ